MEAGTAAVPGLYWKDSLGLTYCKGLSSFDYSFSPPPALSLLLICVPHLDPRSRSCSSCWPKHMTASGACKSSSPRSGSCGRRRPKTSTRKWCRWVVPSALLHLLQPVFPEPNLSGPWVFRGRNVRGNLCLLAPCCTVAYALAVLGWNPGLVVDCLCDLRPILSPLCASVSHL